MTCSAAIVKEDDLYVAECPEVGTVSQGTTIEEALANLQEATELYLEEFPASASSDIALIRLGNFCRFRVAVVDQHAVSQRE